jgi:putative copper export protein
MGTTQALRAVLLLAHLAAAAAWIGAMAYSLAIVQPRARRFLGRTAFALGAVAGAVR